MDLTADEVHRFAEACSDPEHRKAAEVMLAFGASSATGVLAQILLANGEVREHLIALVRGAISE